jgi:hypothetical protein
MTGALCASTAPAQTTAPAPQLVADEATAPPAFTNAASSSAMSAAPVGLSSSIDLPDAPSTMPLHAFLPSASEPASVAPTARKYAKDILPGQTAQSLTPGDKVILGLRDTYSSQDVLAWIAAAGYEQVTNGSPNYGTDRGAFGQRLGAAAIRETSQGIFTDCVFAPILHMDSRYYIQGEQFGVFHRTVYAVTRVLVSKTDSGRATINAPLLLGYATSTAISNGYYPQINRNFKDSASEYGGSLGGAAIGFLVDEFSDGILKTFHLKHR